MFTIKQQSSNKNVWQIFTKYLLKHYLLLLAEVLALLRSPVLILLAINFKKGWVIHWYIYNFISVINSGEQVNKCWKVN